MNTARLPATLNRIEYDASPLTEVVCQLRFPKLLAIEGRPPVEFQSRIYDDYPDLDARDTMMIAIASLSGGELPQRPMSSKIYDFHSDDRGHRITLTNDFVALSASRYENWEGFRQRLAQVFEALQLAYDVRTITRVGLRYVNRIDLAQLDLADVPSDQLLKTSLLGMTVDPGFGIDEYQSVATIKREAGSADLRFTCETYPKRVFYIDWDLYSEESRKANANDIIGLLDKFHNDGSEIFRWCIEDRLHEAFKPRSSSS